jgi:hypothetical protein
MPADGATWTKVSAEYDAASGRMQIRFDEVVVAEQTFAPAVLAGTGAMLTIGGTGAAAACPPAGGNFAGTLDEVSVSRVARNIGTPEPMVDAGAGPDGGNGGDGDAGTGGDGGNDANGDGGGGCCRVAGNGGRSAEAGDGLRTAVLGLLVAAAVIGRRRRRIRRRSQRG